ncbi:hypothetical protein PLICRDRAFT_558380 [Plicaturopsis crispa FD-325 SS-3]|nr:hypothetical protein PLICRDRAFT_558380 [Plicaturopsis crispa FD-325 SS-3]
MAERDPRRHSPPPPSSSNSGLLSNVFSFVSREIESFVTNATGGTVQDEDPRDYARRSKGPANGVHRTKKRHRGRTDEVKRHGRDREGRRRVASPASPSQSSPRGILPQSRSDAHGRRNGTPQARVAAPEQEASAVEDEETEYTVSVHSRSPSPKQQKPALRRRSSISMPGSLFPRSTSLEPDSPDEDEQHVRFDSHQPSRVSGAGPSDPRASRREASPEHVPSSPLRPRAVPSVKEAVSRFVVTDDGADASILLPSPSVSPGNRREKRQCRDGDGLSEKAKGKQRAVEEEYVPLTHRDRATAIPISEADTSADIRVRGKERELVVAREEQHANERRWEQDKNDDAAKENSKNKERIKMLEEEIMRLKAELLRRPAVSSASDTRNMHLPPPPPPPPPPPLPLPGVKSRLPAATRATSDSLFASARAALKHTGTPVEAPINGPALGSRAKRQGQPTVNVPSDKMAAFLNEMKTVRLRKVSGGAQGAPASSATSSMAGTSALARSTSSASGSGPSRFAVPARPSLPFDTRAGQERLGEKRKRDEFQDTLRKSPHSQGN